MNYVKLAKNCSQSPKYLELIDADERKEKAISQMLVLRIFFFNTIFIQDILPCAE